jgi:hypothetical protein
LGAGTLADSLTRSVLAWVLNRGLRLAIGTCVLALLLATTLSGAAAERFATVAYLTAIFAAFVLALGRFFPAGAEERRAPSHAFPVFLGYSLGVVVLLSVTAVLVSQPGAEAVALLAAVALMGTLVLVRCGTLAALNAVLVRGGFLVAVSRYAALAIVVTLAFAAALGSDADSSAAFAFRLTIVATMAIAASLLAPTGAGLWAQKRYRQTIEELDRLTRDFVFERTAIYGAIVAVAAMVAAALLQQPYGEDFAIVAYLAAAAAAFGVAMECRRLRP